MHRERAGPDDGLPSYLQGYTTVNGVRCGRRPIIQEELPRRRS